MQDNEAPARREARAELPPVTDSLLDALEFRYAVPRCCRVCGAPLELNDTRNMKMACTSDAASMFRDRQDKAGVGWQEALNHRIESEMCNPPDGDIRVLALVAEFRAMCDYVLEQGGSRV